jgi:hypothetical protein
MPAARIAGLDEFAKWLVASVGLVGSLGAAFSSSVIKSFTTAGSIAFAMGVLLAGISLFLAIWLRSVEPGWANWQNLDDMLKKQDAALTTKKRLAWFSGLAFGLALLSAGLAPLLTVVPATQPPALDACPDARGWTGRYTNYSYGFSIEIPEHLQGFWNSARCSNGSDGCVCISDHGRIIPLTAEPHEQECHIEVYAGYAVDVDEPSLQFEVAKRLAGIQQRTDGRKVEIRRRSEILLAGIEAERVLVPTMIRNLTCGESRILLKRCAPASGTRFTSTLAKSRMPRIARSLAPSLGVSPSPRTSEMTDAPLAELGSKKQRFRTSFWTEPPQVCFHKSTLMPSIQQRAEDRLRASSCH